MADKERDFKGVWIPKEVWLDTRLSSLEKVILTEIDSLDNGDRGCFASNKYIADFCQCGETKVSNAISKLVDLGYLKIQSFDGRQRELKSNLTRNAYMLDDFDEATLQKMKGRLTESVRQTYKKCEADLQKVKAINIDNNTESIKYIVDYLNSTIGTSYKASSKDTQKHISARLKEGYTVEDFKAVIDKQYAKWKGTEYEQYLRPSTLFGTKFESYLNAKPTKPQDNPSGSDKGWNGTSGRTDF